MTTAESVLPPELETLGREYRHASEETRNLLTYHSEEALRRRPRHGSWSALECVAHLNLATQAMMPGIQQAVEAAPSATDEKRKLRMDMTGRFLAWGLEPPPIIKIKTIKLAEPVQNEPLEPVLLEFERQHAQLLELLKAAAGKQIDQRKMKSPFANIQYNAYSAFRIIAAHDRRHLWQARLALR